MSRHPGAGTQPMRRRVVVHEGTDVLPAVAVERVASTWLPTDHARFRMHGFRDSNGVEHVALVHGDVAGAPDPVLLRMHSECLTGDALGSRRCDCGEQLQASMARIAAAGVGVVIYVRGHEGRGIGLLEKLRAYALQDRGVDTVDANLALGHPADARTFDAAAAILRDLGVQRVDLLSSNPLKEHALTALNVEVSRRRGLDVLDRADNAAYLETKRRRMSHDAAGRTSSPPPPPSSKPTSHPTSAPTTTTATDAEVWRSLLAGRPAADPDHELVRRYGPLATAPRVVVAQLAQSADGFITSAAGTGDVVTGPEDHRHLHRLRALVDAVVVGVTTVVVDDPRLTVRETEGDDPVRVVLDPHGRAPRTAGVFTDGLAPTLWLTGRPDVRPPSDQVEVVHLAGPDGGPLAAARVPGAVVAILRERGRGRVLVEGGGRTVSSFLAAGALDRLYLTTAPILMGGGVPGLRFEALGSRTGIHRPTVRRHLLGADTCTEFDLSVG
ncbi:GTP cyclohydrolase II [Litorihabitans aurantiacus]|uniref:GTP cyclohydrolase-2 n=1 Tax=Litorihabitans aurantiacus TaxID=1930061 RepID=A0AA38CVG6_9MICO|nr:GTP cyclohydrolase II [Litorihabitans aurantiacus]GMA32920.1 hypothetical protein GCM10025875_29120 [Litorihabitans aurantiacus]